LLQALPAHPNLNALLGGAPCERPGGHVLLLLELCSGGTLVIVQGSFTAQILTKTFIKCPAT
jgi:hypothetical protein